jgi:hypothetical protein
LIDKFGSKPVPVRVNTCVAVSPPATLVGEIPVTTGGEAILFHPSAVYDSIYPVVVL